MTDQLFMQMREEQAMQSGISFEHLIDAKKSNLQQAINTITNAVKDGDYDALKALILSVKGKLLFTDLEKELRPLAEDNYLGKLEKGYSIYDVKIEQGSTKTDYDYSVCGDPVYVRLASNLVAAKAAVDERCALLKTLSKPMEMIDEETGETFRCMPPNRLSKEGLKLTINK